MLRLVKISGAGWFAVEIFKELRKRKYDLILSQSFVAAVALYPCNLVYRISHILTIHGIVEEEYAGGRFGFIK
jgi:hypothetical protein